MFLHNFCSVYQHLNFLTWKWVNFNTHTPGILKASLQHIKKRKASHVTETVTVSCKNKDFCQQPILLQGSHLAYVVRRTENSYCSTVQN